MKKFDIDSLVLEIESHGIHADDAAVARLAHAAEVQGIKPILVEVMTDEAAPEPARVRAFGRLATLVDTANIERIDERELAHSA